jgi:hypothetical protein
MVQSFKSPTKLIKKTASKISSIENVFHDKPLVSLKGKSYKILTYLILHHWIVKKFLHFGLVLFTQATGIADFISNVRIFSASQ